MTTFPAGHGPSPVRVGFVGFGEVAAVFAGAMEQAGAEVLAHDVVAAAPGGMARLAERAGATRVRFVGLAELARDSAWILSTVTSAVAQGVAAAVAPHLRAGQHYVDLNATSPAVKQAVAGLVGASGAHFVEGAILTAVGVTGARTRILIGDADGPGAAEALAGLGLNAAFYSGEIGRASAFKLLRSVFSKGLEALLLEFLVAGRRAGLQEDLWREVVDLFARNAFERVADNWIRTHATAHARRHHEIVAVAEEMRALGLEPVMTSATEALFRRSAAVRWNDALGGQPATVETVIAALERSAAAPDPAATIS